MRAAGSLRALLLKEKQARRRVSTPCVVLFLTCFGTAAASLECPHQCVCTGTTVECNRQNLTSIPQPIPANTTTLLLTGNDISHLTEESFPVRLDYLAELYLPENRIEQVAPGVFDSLPRLRLLDLSNNKIWNFSPDAFPEHNMLQVLNLSGSLYNFSYTDVFCNLLKHAVPKLSNLSLANNDLVVLPDDMFTSLSDLTTLDLRNNSIVSIKNVTFRNNALISLDLRNNALKELSNGTLKEFNQIPGLQLYLLGNQWVCDCNIEDMVMWLQSSDVVVDKQHMTCTQPEKLRTSQLLQLKHSELQCTDSGNMEVTLETSYVFLGMVLALIGVIFLLVLYLNRKGIKRWMYNIRDACRDHMEGYHYRYEINSDPRLANLSLNSDV
ncbi:trophoblast glycoprotein b [Pangasianodon hypophthalmus]|uniref:trophoblast glycoprotein b n=1 Tax=Pangasianodon hypophthalmus TaxID=310915 RepID=UPI002306F82A|nr:trophoblast glycoprotein b [Pangasianodon hypophthalmus]